MVTAALVRTWPQLAEVPLIATKAAAEGQGYAHMLLRVRKRLVLQPAATHTGAVRCWRGAGAEHPLHWGSVCSGGWVGVDASGGDPHLLQRPPALCCPLFAAALQALGGLLAQAKVPWLCLPAPRERAADWRRGFGFAAEPDAAARWVLMSTLPASLSNPHSSCHTSALLSNSYIASFSDVIVTDSGKTRAWLCSQAW